MIEMKKRKMFALLILAFILVACESVTQTTDTYQEPNYTTEMAVDNEVSVNREQSNENRDVIYTASVNYQTINYNDAKQGINEIIEANDGYIQYQDESVNEYSYTESSQTLTNLYMIIRVPQENYEQILEQFEANDQAQLMKLSRGSQDVTQQVQDIEIRIESIESRIDRLNELNDQAESIADLIEIQAALEEAIAERDILLADQTAISGEIDNATINLNLQEVIELSDRSDSQLTFWDRIVSAFNETWENSIDAFQWGILTLIFLIPYIIVILIILLIIRFILRPLFRKIKSALPKRKERTISRTNENENNNNTE